MESLSDPAHIRVHLYRAPLLENEILGFLGEVPLLKAISLGVQKPLDLHSTQLVKYLAQLPAFKSLQIGLMVPELIPSSFVAP